MSRIIGIDLGTTNSVAAYWKGRKPRIIENEYSTFTPSVVWMERALKRVGRDAKDRLETGSENIIYSVKRFMGVDFDDVDTQKALSKNLGYNVRKAPNGEVEIALDGQYLSPVEISAMILEQVKKDAEIKLGEPVTHAVITVPAYFGQRQKNATREAGQLAGLAVARIIPEPTAAALAFGVEEEIDEPQDVLVFDLGGGTFDVSILSIIDNNFDVLNIDGDRFLGGDDFDNEIINRIVEQIWRQEKVDLNSRPDHKAIRARLKAIAERAKIELSRSEDSPIEAVVATIDGRPINVRMNLTRPEFEAMIAPTIDRSIEITMRALSDASLQPTDLDRVLLVGGSTRVPLVRRRLKELFGDRIEIDVDPMQCVALGAAVQTAFLTEEELEAASRSESVSLGPRSTVIVDKSDDLAQFTMQDMIPKWIGIETVSGDLVTVIPKGTLYPTHEPYKQIFETNHNGQQVYELPVYESEQENNPRSKWEAIGKVRNDKLPPGLPKGSDIMVEMSLDSDGTLTVVSYLKNDPYKDDPQRSTLDAKSFHFISKASTPTEAEEVMSFVDFWAFALRALTEDVRLARHMTQDEIRAAQRMSARAEAIIREKDIAAATALKPEIEELRDALPSQAIVMLFSFLITSNSEVVSPVERGEVQQLITQMELAIDRDDIDTANVHFRNLQHKNDLLIKKYPSVLVNAKKV